MISRWLTAVKELLVDFCSSRSFRIAVVLSLLLSLLLVAANGVLVYGEAAAPGDVIPMLVFGVFIIFSSAFILRWLGWFLRR